MAEAGQIKDSDRLGFTLFLALAFHAVIVLGITFVPQDPTPASQTMDVTLAQHVSEKPPEEADFMADADQEGSGELAERAELTATETPRISAEQVLPVEPLPQAAQTPAAVTPAAEDPVLTSRSSDRSVARQTDPSDRPEQQEEKAPSLMERSLAIASLEARLADQQNEYAKRPRVTTITAASTVASHDAWYVQNWQQRVEAIGNAQYPEQARRDGIHGQVRMLVAINRDGTLRDITVLQSSGHSVLDDAAMRIVRQASPFAPFTEAMKEDKDVLEIIRTWSFQRRGLSAG
ncbi:MAG: energy transducer TonB [Halomonadaceae bacterium]|nr:MAG: energy transducer TonB [Halomonadaceae bacterium]